MAVAHVVAVERSARPEGLSIEVEAAVSRSRPCSSPPRSARRRPTNHSPESSASRTEPSPEYRTSYVASCPDALPNESRLVPEAATRAETPEARATYGRSASGVVPSSRTPPNQRVAATSSVRMFSSAE